MKFKTKKDKWFWFGGFVDGEGCLSLVYHPKKVYPHSYRKTPYWDIRLTIVNTSRRLMDFLKKEFGGDYYIQKKINHPINKKILFQWIETGKDLEKILIMIAKYSYLKSGIAKLLLQSLKTKNNKKLKKIHKKIHILNQSGI